ncbi:MAG: CBS domain-containing protein [Candidatus Binatia bacterium]|jgi:CBS domain-containing protein
MVAKDIMTKKVITVMPLTTVKNLAKTLSGNNISGVPVVDQRGKVMGIVSEADVVAKSGKQVKGIMSKNVVSVNEETEVEEIARLLAAHRFNRVPVLRQGKLVGIVSRADIIRAIAMGKHIALHTPIYDL